MPEQSFPFARDEGTIHKTKECIMSAGRERRDESARRSESVRNEIGSKNNQRPQKKKQCTEAAVQEVQGSKHGREEEKERSSGKEG